MEGLNMNIGQEYLRAVRERFLDMKTTAEKAMEQLSEEELFIVSMKNQIVLPLLSNI
jgi:Protein of unknown function (DUF1572)